MPVGASALEDGAACRSSGALLQRGLTWLCGAAARFFKLSGADRRCSWQGRGAACKGPSWKACQKKDFCFVGAHSSLKGSGQIPEDLPKLASGTQHGSMQLIMEDATWRTAVGTGSLPAAMADPLGCCIAGPLKAAALGSVPFTSGASLAAA